MERFLIKNEGAAQRFGLSTAAKAGGLVFAAAMALDYDALKRLEAAKTIEDETRICLQNLSDALEASGSSLADVVKMNCYLTEDEYRAEFWATYDEIFKGIPGKRVRLTQVTGIAGGCRVELDAIATAKGA